MILVVSAVKIFVINVLLKYEMYQGDNVMNISCISFLKLMTGFLLASLACIALNAAVLEEVVVTAQKREQNLSDVGISITAFTGEQMKALGVSSTQGLHNQTPGLIVTDFGGGTTTVFTMRGAGQLDFNDQQEGPVAVYIDGAYNSYLAGVGFNFYDLERVEILRGSQGTLFGRNATAGLVHIISAKPTDEHEGYVEVTGGEYGQIKVEGAVSGPLGETLNGRLSMYYEHTDGYIENSTGDDSHDVGNYSGRAQLLFEPSDKLSVLVIGHWAMDDTNADIYDIRPAVTDVGGLTGLPGDGFVKEAGPASHFDFCSNVLPVINGLPPGFVTPALGAADCFGNFNNDGPFRASTNFNSFFERDHFGVTGTIDYETDWGTITSITDWQDFKKRYNEDSDSTPATLFHFFQDMDSNQFSEELRLAGESERARWVVGAYYLNIDSNGRTGVEATGSLGIGLDNLWELDTTTYAFFGQFEYDFNDAFTGIAGIRWTEDEKDFSITPRCTFLPNLAGLNATDCLVLAPFIQGVGLPTTRRSEGDWSGHIELDWHINDDTMAYAKIARGHKAGGFNGGIISFFFANEITYDSELPVTYEGGLKTQFANGKVRLNASVFYTDYKNFQTFTQQGPSLILFNVDSEVLGSEIELTLNPWDGWDFLFGLSLLDAEQKNLTGAGGTIDRQMPNAPDVSFNALGRYEWSAFGGRMAAQVDMNYVDDRPLNAIGDPGLRDGSYTVANASVQWTSANDQWLLKLWVKNFNDEVYFPTNFDITTITGVTQPVVSAPRWFGGTVGYHW